MSSPDRQSGLTIAEDIRHQRLVWVIERISWGIMALVIIAGLVGLLGVGPLSSRVIAEPDSGLVIRYNRFERNQTTTIISMDLNPSAQPGGQTRLSIGRETFAHLELVSINPEPVQVEAWPGHITYVFNLPDPDKAAEVTFYLLPIKFGSVQVSMKLDGYREQNFSQFIYP